VSWWHRKKCSKRRELEAYVARERAEAEAVNADTRRQVEETRSLREKSSRVHAESQQIHKENGFTTWLMDLLRGVQEDGR
jgi:hypothetical protein